MDDNHNENQNNEGMSVNEIENFAKKYRFEVAFLVFFVLSTFFTFVFWGATWSICLAGLGGVLGVWIPSQLGAAVRKGFSFIFGQEFVTQVIIAVVGVVVSIFLAPVIFLLLGIMGGVGLHGAHRG